MNAKAHTGPQDAGDDRRLREINAALLRASVQQHELLEAASLNATALSESKSELRGQLDDTERLRNLSAEMIRGDLATLYDKIVEAAEAIMHAEFASMQLLQRGAQDELILLACRGFTPEAVRAWRCVSAGPTSCCGLALASGVRTLVPDVESCADLAGTRALEIYRQTGIRAVQSTPLHSRSGVLVGMLSTHWKQPRVPSPHELQLLDLLARQAADLLDRAQADERLRTSAEESRRLLELQQRTTISMAEGLYTIDVQGRATSVNPEAERLLGWSRGELLGQCMHEVMHYRRPDGSAFPKSSCAKMHALRTGDVLVGREDEFIRRDGTSFPVSYSCAPLRGADGAIVGMVVVFQDVSERQRARKQLERAAADLADTNQRKDEFLAMLSHELRNPLAPISAAVQLLRIQEDGGDRLVDRQARDVIERQVGNLTRIVDDLLDVARVVSGRVHLDMQVLDLNRIAAHAIETSRHAAEQRKHVLSFDPCPAGAWVRGDLTRLEEVLVNLLVNAVKYTPDGGHIELHCDKPQGMNVAELRIRDDGMGIDAELLRGGRIFDLFTQADRSIARSAGGMGVGLSLVHRLVALHGGSIAVASPPPGASKGSEFIVRLPLVDAPGHAGLDEVRAPPPRAGGTRVLVVDDNRDLVTVLGSTLRQAGFRVESALSGIEGLRVARQWQPDVVLLDIGLPGLDGYEVARRLRADPELSRRPAAMRIIALTGYGRETDVALAREAGFDAHLIKPVAFPDLVRLLAAP